MANWSILHIESKSTSKKISRGVILKRFKNIARFFLIFSLILCFISSVDLLNINVIADDILTTGVDVIMVLDCTGSMATTDADKYSVDGAKLMLDQLFDKEKSRYGVVMFDGEVRDVLPLQRLNTDALREEMRAEIVRKYGQDGPNTDTVRGLARALQELEQNPSDNKRMIILFTDGYDNPVRTEEELKKERDFVLARCAELGIPVYTIGLDVRGSLGAEAAAILKDIADKTNAESHPISSGKEIQDAIPKIYRHFMTSLNPDAESGIFGSGAYEKIVGVPDPYMLYLNVNVLSDSEVIDVRVFNPGGDDVTANANKVYISQSPGRYSTVQITQPEKGDWKVTLKGEEGIEFTMDFVYLYTLRISQNIAGKDGQPDYSVGNARIEARLATETGDVSDLNIYNDIKTVIFMIAGEDGKENIYEGKYESDCFAADISDLPEGDYEVTAHLEHKYFTRDSFDPINITLGQPDPSAGKSNIQTTTSGNSTASTNEKFPIWIILIIAGAVILIIVIIAIALNKKGGKDEPIKGEFEIDISNDNGNIEVFRTGGLFYDSNIRNISLSDMLHWGRVDVGTKEATAICGDIILAGRKEGVIFKIKRKDLTIMSSDARIDGHNALSTQGGYVMIDFNDNDNTRIRISLG